MRLAGKVAIITGAGSGIGKACAQSFAREGASIALVARRGDRLKQVAAEIGATGGKALVLAQDISVARAAEVIMRQTLEQFGRLDVLLNSAAVLYAGTAESQSEAEWDETFAVNVRALWQLSRAALAPMRKAGGGSIINISSVLGLVGARNRAAYAASKGAVTLLTKAMALDHATEHIRVNCICPGIVETELVADFVNKAPDPEQARRQREALHPMNRFGQPAEIAAAAVFLASDESRWITGVALPVDGGYIAV